MKLRIGIHFGGFLVIFTAITSCSQHFESIQTDAELMVVEWERIGRNIVNLQSDILTLISQSGYVVKMLNENVVVNRQQLDESAQDDGSNYYVYYHDSLIKSIFMLHQQIVRLQDSIDYVLKNYNNDRKLFHQFHRKLKTSKYETNSFRKFNLHFQTRAARLDKQSQTLRFKIDGIVETYNSTLTELVENNPLCFALSGYKLKLK
ncbi:MAG: hypothetical protein RMM53_06710 [Bacteroidia bacterium]|nr:hypothetical protein [Bacteroidia bacterium]